MSTPDPKAIDHAAQIILDHLHPAGGTWRLNPEAAARSLHEAGWRSPQEVQALQDRIDALTEVSPSASTQEGTPAVKTKTFHISDILTVTTGRLVSTRHIEGVYDILNWMTGDNLMTHQLPRANDECEPSLRAQFPDLAAVVAPEFESEASVTTWVEAMVAEHGETREVAPLAPEDHTCIDPIVELVQMRGGTDGIIVMDRSKE